MLKNKVDTIVNKANRCERGGLAMMVFIMFSPLLIVLFIVMGIIEERRRSKKKKEKEAKEIASFDQWEKEGQDRSKNDYEQFMKDADQQQEDSKK